MRNIHRRIFTDTFYGMKLGFGLWLVFGLRLVLE